MSEKIYRHFIGVQYLKYNPVIYLSKKAYSIENNNFTPFHYLWNKCNQKIDTHEYYKQLYGHLNTLFYSLNTELCDNTTQFTILSLDIIIRDTKLYLKKFKYHNNDTREDIEEIYNDLYNNQIGNNYIKIYPKINTYNLDR